MRIPDEAARTFLAAASKIHRDVAAASLREVDDAAVAVPGFRAFEVQAQVPVRGWVGHGRAVMARLQNFGPVLEALAFGDAAAWPTPDGLVARLLWLHGPPYQLVTHLADGELGAPDELELTPRLVRRPDGRAGLFFALLDPGGATPSGQTLPPVVFEYRIVRPPDGRYDISTTQVAPVVAEDAP